MFVSWRRLPSRRPPRAARPVAAIAAEIRRMDSRSRLLGPGTRAAHSGPTLHRARSGGWADASEARTGGADVGRAMPCDGGADDLREPELRPPPERPPGGP